MVDQLQHQCVGYRGHPVVRTPHLDALKADAVDFTTTYAQNACCVPSRVSFLSGQYLCHHRQYGFMGMLSEEVPSLPKIFTEQGYHTAHIGKGHFNCFGENLGFAEFITSYGSDYHRSTDPQRSYKAFCEAHGYPFPYDAGGENGGLAYRSNADHPGLRTVGPSSIPLEHSMEAYCADEAIRSIKAQSGAPWFVHLSFDRPHSPHTPSEPYSTMYPPADIELSPEMTAEEWALQPRHIRDYYEFWKQTRGTMDEDNFRYVLSQYFGLISQIDEQIGRVIQQLKDGGLYEDTLIVFSSDHGDFAGKRGLFEKFCNQTYNDDVVRVPLLLKLPGNRHAGREVSDLVETIDLSPTIAELCGVDLTPFPVDGQSLLPRLESGALHRDVAFSESYSMKMIRKGDDKLIYYVNADKFDPATVPEDDDFAAVFSTHELYDLKRDPDERRNIYAGGDPRKIAALKMELVKKLSRSISDGRKSYIDQILNGGDLDGVELNSYIRWHRTIIDAGGIWAVHRDEFRLVCAPFNGFCQLQTTSSTGPFDQRREYVNIEDPVALNRLLDELLNYLSTRITPLSIQIGEPYAHDNTFHSKGFGFC